MSTAVATRARYTPEDLLAMPDGKSYELVDGRLFERRSGARASRVGGKVASRLDQHCEKAGLGWVFGACCGYQCFPHDLNRVRKPSVSFVRFGRFPDQRLPEGWATIAPDLAVEVVSPSELAEELEERLDDYRMAGVPLVWVIYPELRKVRVLRREGSPSDLREDDELSGEDVVPGFRCLLREILPRVQPAETGQPMSNGSNGVE
jgi:Uma2 family endonuclease